MCAQHNDESKKLSVGDMVKILAREAKSQEWMEARFWNDDGWCPMLDLIGSISGNRVVWWKQKIVLGHGEKLLQVHSCDQQQQQQHAEQAGG